MNIFITGGTGFVGSHVVNRLIDLGHNLVILTRRRKQFLHLQDQAHYTSHIPTNFNSYDMIYNMAGVLGSNKTPFSTYQEAHIKIPQELCARANRYIPVVHLSTAYIDSETSHHTYIETKRQSERILKNHFEQLTIVRPGPIFGPGDLHHLPLYKMIKTLGIFCPIPGGSNRFCPTHVSDVANAMMPSTAQPGVLQIAGESVTIEAFMKEVSKWLKTGTPFIKIPAWFKKDFFGVDRLFKSDVQLTRDYPNIISDAVDWYQEEQLV